MQVNQQSVAKNEKQAPLIQSCLLTKSNSTQHIPLGPKSKEGKRIYANYDKNLASAMFGYRVQFQKQAMKKDDGGPEACQRHKLLSKYVAEKINELSSGYIQVPHYATK